MSDLSSPFARFAPLASAYDLALCDVWGVLHDGIHPHLDASDALTRFREGGGTVILVSNAPRSSEWVVQSLDEKGVPRSAWDAVITSGDVARLLLAERDIWKIVHIGPERDLPVLGDDRLERVSLEEGAIAVATGLVDENTETPDDYRERLEALKARGLALICANPDLVVQVGDRTLWCAGAIADAYRTMGGETIYCGKPHPPIYDAAMALAQELAGHRIERSRVIAIGDAVRTDLAGATAAGIDCMFIADGIHGEELGRGSPDPEKLAALFAEHDYKPVAVAPKLAW